MQHLKIVLCSHEGEEHFHLLDELEDVTIVTCAPEQPERLLREAVDMDIYYGRPSVDLLKKSPQLRWIQAPSAGVEFVAKIPELANAEVYLTNTRGAHGLSIGEHAIAVLLAMTRHIPDSVRQQDRHVFDRSVMYRKAREIGGMTMGLIGFGALGRGIAQRALGMQMKVLAVDA